MAESLSWTRLEPGEPAPWFRGRTPSNPEFRFDTLGGRPVALAFVPGMGSPAGIRALASARRHQSLIDGKTISFCCVSLDSRDEQQADLKTATGGIHYFFDSNGEISMAFGVVARNLAPAAVQSHCQPQWILLDRSLRVVQRLPIETEDSILDRALASLSTPATPPPLLILPDVFPADLCRHLIGLHRADGGQDSGVLNESYGQATAQHSGAFKRRRDLILTDPALTKLARSLLLRRLVPFIARSFQFKVTRIERHVVGSYSAQDGGHFSAHRDNTTTASAHRRFAVSIILNDDFSGGGLSFPEFSDQPFSAPPGGAVVFSCSLLHRVHVVESGTRYAYLTFMYDEEGARILEENQKKEGLLF